MRTTFARLATIGMVLWMSIWMAAGGQGALAQDDDQRAGVERVVIDLVRAEQNGDINQLYDYMLPESRDIVPRQAFLTWFAEQEFPVPTGVPEIESIEFFDGEYELTGTEYEDIALVEFSVPVDDAESPISRELELWSDGVTWRWFLNVAEDEVDDIQDGDEFTVEYESLFTTELYRQLDMFWAQIFADEGAAYRSPVDMVGVNVYPLETSCGLLEKEDLQGAAAMYCGWDETIYYDIDFRDWFSGEFGAYSWHHIIAHEWGHHVQNVVGLFTSLDPELYGGAYSIEHELQADCLAAVFTQDVRARGEIRNRDVVDARNLSIVGGDGAGVSWDRQGAHGSEEQRAEAFWLGYEDGLRGCYINFDAAGN